MLRVYQFRFYILGQRVHPLTEMKGAQAYGKLLFPLWRARNALTDLQDDPMKLQVSAPSIATLIRAIDEIVPQDIDEAIAKDRTLELSGVAVDSLATSAKEFEAVLAAELQQSATYFVSQKGAYSTPDLIDHADVLIPEVIRADVADQTKKDIREIGRCLAFNLPTAAAFHALRAVEAEIVGYYKAVIGGPPKDRNWGAYIRDLRDSGKADAKVIGFVEHLKDEYRNPMIHPEAFVTMEEVQILIGAAISAISQMVVASPATSEETKAALQQPNRNED